MRTQTPTPPFDVVGVEMSRYGTPQHETSTATVESLYGPPQHETELEDPDWLISIACKAFGVEDAQLAGCPEINEERNQEEKQREPTVIKL